MSKYELLPTFKGYIVDEVAQRFRKIPTKKGEPSKYISFDSPQGQKMCKEFIALCNYALRKVIILNKNKKK